MTDRFRGQFLRPQNSPRHLDDRDQGLMQAVVTAGAFVALADGHLENACVGVPGAG